MDIKTDLLKENLLSKSYIFNKYFNKKIYIFS